jgi:hypothetical protein
MSRTLNPLLPPRRTSPVMAIQLQTPLSEAELKEQMTYYLREGPVKRLAQLFHENTCPGDWDSQPTAALRRILQTFYEGDFTDCQEPIASTITSIIRYRWEMGLLADRIVNMSGIPVPGNSMCILWDIDSEMSYREETSATNSFTSSCELLPRQPDQGSEFRRPWLYVVASLYEWNESKWEKTRMIQRISDFLQVVKRFNGQSRGRVLPVRRDDCVPR